MTTPSPRNFTTVADRLAGISDPSIGDERERDIALRAGTAAMVVSIFTIQLIGVALAVIGAGLWSVLIILAALIPSGVYSWYCTSAGLAVACAWIAAVAVHVTTGAPLIDVGLGNAVTPDSSTAIGLVTGGIVGGSIGAIALSLSAKRGQKRVAADEEADDED